MKGTLQFIDDAWYVVHREINWHTYNTLNSEDAKLDMFQKRMPDGDLAMNGVEVEFEFIDKPVVIDDIHGEFIVRTAKLVL